MLKRQIIWVDAQTGYDVIIQGDNEKQVVTIDWTGDGDPSTYDVDEIRDLITALSEATAGMAPRNK